MSFTGPIIYEPPSKRPRPGSTYMPIHAVHSGGHASKFLVNVALGSIVAAQQTTTLVTITLPGTMQGLRWELSGLRDAGTGVSTLRWAIVRVQQGHSVSTLATSDGSTLYQPEQEVLTFGVGTGTSNASTPQTYSGVTKTMRKMRAGDTLVLAAIGEATNAWRLTGTVQFFMKT